MKRRTLSTLISLGLLFGLALWSTQIAQQAHAAGGITATTGSAGAATSVDTTQPALGLQWMIRVQNGVFPPRSEGLEPSSRAAADAYLGEIRCFAFDTANLSSDWLPCDGRLLTRNSYLPLFSLLGINFGGNGETNFALPDLRGRVPVGMGGSYEIGAMGGQESTTLSIGQLPGHTHTTPTGNTDSTGGGTAISNEKPYTVLNILMEANHLRGTIGQVRLFAFSFTPPGFYPCVGGTANIADNSDLASALGTAYGGDSTTTFGLPDLTGRTPIGVGQGTGLTARALGAAVGTTTTTLTTTQLPAHQHTIHGGNSGLTGDGSPVAKMGPSLALNSVLATIGTMNSSEATPALGEVRLFAGPTPVTGYTPCDGRTLSSAANANLYDVIGTTFGGNTTNFVLPDLRGRMSAGVGSGPSLTARTLGQVWGAESFTLTAAQMAAHTHTYLLNNLNPVLVTNAGLTLQVNATTTIGNTLLKAKDGDGDTLTYTLVTAPTRGTLRLNSTVLNTSSTFTQADIDANWLTFAAGATPGRDSFTFSISDGFGGSVTGTFSLNLKATPVITWNNPADIPYGTALSATQLNATANVDGSFSYSPVSGTVLGVGNGQTLSVTFTPTDTTSYNTASKDVVINVVKATPTITWSNPADIVYGTALSATQLNATTNVAGTFSYSPVSGTVLNAGNGQMLSVTFTPTDSANYGMANKSVQINVLKVTPIITWTPPAFLLSGALPAAVLNATTNVAGSFSYTPAAGTVLTAGTITITANFTPNESGNYNPVSQSVTLPVLDNSCGITVNPATMPAATRGAPFVQTLSAAPTGSYVFSLLSGTLPPGINLVNTLGIYSLRGTPTTAGSFTFTIKAKKNSSTCEGARTYTIVVP